MNAPVANMKIDQLLVLRERAEARAYLWAAGEILLKQDAVDPLWGAAVSHGLVDALGVDAVQAVIAEVFRRVQC